MVRSMRELLENMFNQQANLSPHVITKPIFELRRIRLKKIGLSILVGTGGLHETKVKELEKAYWG